MDKLKSKSSINSVLSSGIPRAIAVPLSALFLAAVVSFSPEDPKVSAEDKQQEIANYLDRKGCDGLAFLQGKIQSCPENE